jgi:ribosomal protein S18 acetylase RimI-like enzyme
MENRRVHATGGWKVRQAIPADEAALEGLIGSSDRVMLRFRAGTLANCLAGEPFLLLEGDGELTAFLGCSTSHLPMARLAAAGLVDDMPVSLWLDLLLQPCMERLRKVGATSLSYIGSAAWLAETLQERGFRLISHIAAYEKSDLSIPHAGSRVVDVRPAEAGDLPELVTMDALGFHPLWRNSIETFQQWRETLPYFAVAAVGKSQVGYCYCSVDSGHGHLVRMAVHPTWQGQGIGTRLLADAMRFFQEAGARRITLNTQEENERAQWLYRRFGFRSIGREAVALWKDF